MPRILATLLLLALTAGATAAQEPCFEPEAFVQPVAERPAERPLSWVDAQDPLVFAIKDTDVDPPQLRIFTLADPAAPVRLATLTLPDAPVRGLRAVDDRVYVALETGGTAEVLVK